MFIIICRKEWYNVRYKKLKKKSSVSIQGIMYSNLEAGRVRYVDDRGRKVIPVIARFRNEEVVMRVVKSLLYACGQMEFNS